MSSAMSAYEATGPETLSHPLLGIHHVTAIAGDPQANIDFYGGILGLRLVKKTVNFDDPQTYHLYYGDAEGRPGSILTFFPWPGARRGQLGSGQVATVSFAVPAASITSWQQRLEQHGVSAQRHEVLGTPTLRFVDPDGLTLELAATLDATASAELSVPWQGDDAIGPEMAIRGIDHVTLIYGRSEPSVALLTGAMGFEPSEGDDSVQRFGLADGGPTARLDIRHTTAGRGRIAAGSVHHVAFRVADDAAQAWWQQHLSTHQVHVTPVMDRQYFRSVYFREPGGVLFELATDAPGFAIDEPFEALGQQLMLPPGLEAVRADIEAHLPTLRAPGLKAPELKAPAATTPATATPQETIL